MTPQVQFPIDPQAVAGADFGYLKPVRVASLDPDPKRREWAATQALGPEAGHRAVVLP
jgi:hypothetical protein